MLLYWSKNGKAYQPEKLKMRMIRRLHTVRNQMCQLLWPLLPSISRPGRDTTTSRPLATWMGLSPTHQVGLLAKEAPLDPATGLYWTVKWNPVFGLALPPLLEGKDSHKPREDCCWVCARHQFIWPYRQALLVGTTSLRPWRKGTVKPRSHNTAWKQN